MGAEPNIDWAKAAASTLEWWDAAGVDVLTGDAPFDWLAAPPPGEQAPAAPVRHERSLSQRAAPAPAVALALPDTLDAFLAWRTSDAAPEAAWGGRAIPASGPAGADLMVLVDCPDPDDADALLTGEAARLFDRMLAAIGRSRADIHLVAVANVRPIAGRVPRETEARLGEIAAHHVALAAPRRLLLLGNAPSRAILSADVAEARGRLHALNHRIVRTGGTVSEAVASFHPRFLRQRPATKAEAWRDLQLLIGGMSS